MREERGHRGTKWEAETETGGAQCAGCIVQCKKSTGRTVRSFSIPLSVRYCTVHLAFYSDTARHATVAARLCLALRICAATRTVQKAAGAGDRGEVAIAWV